MIQSMLTSVNKNTAEVLTSLKTMVNEIKYANRPIQQHNIDNTRQRLLRSPVGQEDVVVASDDRHYGRKLRSPNLHNRNTVI